MNELAIRIKGIWHERTEDAPFIGALVSSVDCKKGCKNCFNQHIKDTITTITSSKMIIDEIKQNPLNQGIILAGLEWTLQGDELKEMVEVSLKNNLKVILYTGLTEDEFRSKFPSIYESPIYIKFGEYREDQKSDCYFDCGVKLASTNQYIKYFGE